MTLDGIRVDHGALERASAEMQYTVREIDERLNRLERDLDPLRSDWSGRAQQSYVAAKATWDRAIADMKDLLAETHTSVRQSNVDYLAADVRGAARFGG